MNGKKLPPSRPGLETKPSPSTHTADLFPTRYHGLLLVPRILSPRHPARIFRELRNRVLVVNHADRNASPPQTARDPESRMFATNNDGAYWPDFCSTRVAVQCSWMGFVALQVYDR